MLLEKADLVTATADKLFQQAREKVEGRLILNPNAVDVMHFSRTISEPPKDIAHIVDNKKPIIGYYGALAEWFDYDLLKYLAENTDYNYVMIGPDYDNSMHEHGLDLISNIYILGPRKYEDLPCYLQFFDVAIIPFKINKITESTSPVKLFEYMAGGKPIVTTAMHECKKYKSVLIAESKEDFIKKIEQAIKLKNSKEYIRLLEKEASENTWDARVKEILKSIKKEKN
jgi:glycosyltransferase involved in cell wall biosynthesis